MKTYRLTKNKHFKSLAIILVLMIFVFSLGNYLYKPQAHAQIFLTSGSTWTVPSDWSNNSNTIELIGGGGGGGGGAAASGQTDGGGGGGGGSYAKLTNATLSPGQIVGINIGAGGAGNIGNGNNGGDTYLCSSTSNCTSLTDTSVIASAAGGTGGTGALATFGPGGAGGTTTNNRGILFYAGGTGGDGASVGGNTGGGGGGGGGAAGKNAVGNSGTGGSNNIGGIGGQGDGSFGGAGGASNGATGGNGTEYDSTHGSGGGGGGGNGSTNANGTPGGLGGQYGAGGGGGTGSKRSTAGSGAAGVQGLIRISYTFTSQQDYRWRLDDGNETTGTSLVAQDTMATVNYGTPVRLRISLDNLGDTTTFSYRLEYAPYTGSCINWTAVPATATTEHFNIYNSLNYSDQAASTNVTTGPGVITDPAGYSFTPGKMVKNPSNTATNETLNANNFSELEFAITANSNATYGSYCFRLATSAGTALDSYVNYPRLNINYPPSTPTIYSVVNGTTSAPRLPVFQVKSQDNNADYLKYVVEVCPANSWPCSTGGHTYSESSTCWSGQDAQLNTAYNSNSLLSLSTVANCQLPNSDILNPNTTYYMRAKAIDPGGSNTYSAYSSVASFTTAPLDIMINGNTLINGNTAIGN